MAHKFTKEQASKGGRASGASKVRANARASARARWTRPFVVVTPDPATGEKAGVLYVPATYLRQLGLKSSKIDLAIPLREYLELAEITGQAPLPEDVRSYIAGEW